MMTIARTPKKYDSQEIYAEYMMMLDNLHLYLLEKGMIVDKDKILGLDIGWDYNRHYLWVETEMLGKIFVDADIFDEYVENGFKL